ncbi:MAG: hypothetical protein EBT13_03880 [Rhodobacteraceae bacterium]|nr:hypothetical protein [Paracoccaceae bacterium]
MRHLKIDEHIDAVRGGANLHDRWAREYPIADVREIDEFPSELPNWMPRLGKINHPIDNETNQSLCLDLNPANAATCADEERQSRTDRHVESNHPIKRIKSNGPCHHRPFHLDKRRRMSPWPLT